MPDRDSAARPKSYLVAVAAELKGPPSIFEEISVTSAVLPPVRFIICQLQALKRSAVNKREVNV